MEKNLFDMWEKRFKKSWPYLWPWFLLPLTLVYGIELLTFVLWLIQIVATVAIFFYIITFICGAVLGVMQMIPNSNNLNMIKNIKLYKVLPPMQWGYDFIQWLLREEKEEE